MRRKRKKASKKLKTKDSRSATKQMRRTHTARERESHPEHGGSAPARHDCDSRV